MHKISPRIETHGIEDGSHLWLRSDRFMGPTSTSRIIASTASRCQWILTTIEVRRPFHKPVKHCIMNISSHQLRVLAVIAISGYCLLLPTVWYMHMPNGEMRGANFCLALSSCLYLPFLHGSISRLHLAGLMPRSPGLLMAFCYMV